MKRMLILGLLVGLAVLVYWLKAPAELPIHAQLPESTPKSAASPDDTGMKALVLATPPEHVKREEAEPSAEAREARDHLVQQKLDNFIKKTAHITQESVARERERIAKGIDAANARPTEKPRVTREVDKSGQGWEKLQFDNGIVRYVPAVEEQTL